MTVHSHHPRLGNPDFGVARRSSPPIVKRGEVVQYVESGYLQCAAHIVRLRRARVGVGVIRALCGLDAPQIKAVIQHAGYIGDRIAATDRSLVSKTAFHLDEWLGPGFEPNAHHLT